MGKWGEQKDWREREEEGGKPVTKWGREKMRKQRVEKKKKSVPNVEVGSGRPPRDEGGNQGGGGVRGWEGGSNIKII